MEILQTLVCSNGVLVPWLQTIINHQSDDKPIIVEVSSTLLLHYGASIDVKENPKHADMMDRPRSLYTETKEHHDNNRKQEKANNNNDQLRRSVASLLSDQDEGRSTWNINKLLEWSIDELGELVSMAAMTSSIDYVHSVSVWNSLLGLRGLGRKKKIDHLDEIRQLREIRQRTLACSKQPHLDHKLTSPGMDGIKMAPSKNFAWGDCTSYVLSVIKEFNDLQLNIHKYEDKDDPDGMLDAKKATYVLFLMAMGHLLHTGYEKVVTLTMVGISRTVCVPVVMPFHTDAGAKTNATFEHVTQSTPNPFFGYLDSTSPLVDFKTGSQDDPGAIIVAALAKHIGELPRNIQLILPEGRLPREDALLSQALESRNLHFEIFPNVIDYCPAFSKDLLYKEHGGGTVQERTKLWADMCAGTSQTASLLSFFATLMLRDQKRALDTCADALRTQLRFLESRLNEADTAEHREEIRRCYHALDSMFDEDVRMDPEYVEFITRALERANTILPWFFNPVNDGVRETYNLGGRIFDYSNRGPADVEEPHEAADSDTHGIFGKQHFEALLGGDPLTVNSLKVQTWKDRHDRCEAALRAISSEEYGVGSTVTVLNFEMFHVDEDAYRDLDMGYLDDNLVRQISSSVLVVTAGTIRMTDFGYIETSDDFNYEPVVEIDSKQEFADKMAAGGLNGYCFYSQMPRASTTCDAQVIVVRVSLRGVELANTLAKLGEAQVQDALNTWIAERRAERRKTKTNNDERLTRSWTLTSNVINRNAERGELPEESKWGGGVSSASMMNDLYALYPLGITGSSLYPLLFAKGGPVNVQSWGSKSFAVEGMLIWDRSRIASVVYKGSPPSAMNHDNMALACTVLRGSGRYRVTFVDEGATSTTGLLLDLSLIGICEIKFGICGSGQMNPPLPLDMEHMEAVLLRFIARSADLMTWNHSILGIVLARFVFPDALAFKFKPGDALEAPVYTQLFQMPIENNANGQTIVVSRVQIVCKLTIAYVLKLNDLPAYMLESKEIRKLLDLHYNSDLLMWKELDTNAWLRLSVVLLPSAAREEDIRKRTRSSIFTPYPHALDHVYSPFGIAGMILNLVMQATTQDVPVWSDSEEPLHVAIGNIRDHFPTTEAICVGKSDNLNEWEKQIMIAEFEQRLCPNAFATQKRILSDATHPLSWPCVITIRHVIVFLRCFMKKLISDVPLPRVQAEMREDVFQLSHQTNNVPQYYWAARLFVFCGGKIDTMRSWKRCAEPSDDGDNNGDGMYMATYTQEMCRLLKTYMWQAAVRVIIIPPILL